MCEWLSHAEWCDVKLLCGGRSFNAHRAVLASVSKFMRRLLLSCPIDEACTFIVLSDFDVDAMSSVLYYIYNGEVIVPKHKLELFLDIIQAMQIYVDCQYLPKIRDSKDNSFNFNSSYYASMRKTEIFTLRFGDDTNQRLLNIRRGTELQSVLLQYSQSNTDFDDNIVRCQNESELHRSRLGNLKSPYGDRQRNSFLRDLFIETYPRNGNVNGLTEGVLAISNECYRSPASVLLTNANGKHLVDDALSSFNTKITQQSLNMPTILDSAQQLECTNNYSRKCLKEPKDMTCVYGNYDTIGDLSQQFRDKRTLSAMNTFLPVDAQVQSTLAAECGLTNVSLQKNRFGRGDKITDLKSNYCSKIIYNQVLENPWTPRKPIDFRPFRRKDELLETQNLKVEKIEVVNDSNNNIQTSTITESREEPTEKISFETVRTMSSRMNICRDDFKCTHCNQVFPCSESLAVHMRRHSSTARYTCGECGKTFSQLRNFKYHMSIHRGTREFAATCTVCGKYFNDRGYLSSHMKIHRNRKEYKCTLCPKSFNQRVAYNMHVRIHTGLKPHVCEECGKAFSRKMLLKQHQRTHSGERPYACPHCDKRFADRSNMTLHLRLHTGVKPFSCSLCPKSFTKKHHLKSHLNFHTGSKPYSCPRCKLAFTQSSNMRTHFKKCSAPDPSSGNDSLSNME